MAIKVPCVSCGRTLSAPDSAAGKRARCPSCGTIQQLPAAANPVEDVLEPEPVAEPVYDAPQEDPFAQNDAPTDEYAMAAEAPPLPASAPGAAGGGEARRPCPMCGEMIPAKAMKCRFCNTIFDPALRKAEAKRVKGGGAGDDDLTAGEWVIALICSGIGCICGIVWMIQGKPKGKKMFFVSLGATVFWQIVRTAVETSTRR